MKKQISEEQIMLIRDFTLISILFNDIEQVTEDPKQVAKPEIKEVYEVLKQCINPLEKVIDKVFRNQSISKTTFIQDIEKKIIYNIEFHAKKNYKI